MKGQLSFEYLIAFGIFVGTVVYIYLSYIGNIPRFVDEVQKEAIRANVYQISEILVNNPGEPVNWANAATSKRIGFLNETANLNNFLSKTKILNGMGFCRSNYNDFRNKIGTDKQFTLILFDINTQTGSRTLIDGCTPNIQKTSVNATIKRIFTYTESNGLIKIGEMIVQV